MPAPEPTDSRPKVASLCGTFLKPEMQSLYRQVANLQRFRNVVLTEKVENPSQFPFEPVIVLNKLARPRPRGNFVLRFWYKYVVKQWPPPREIRKFSKEPYFPYDLPKVLKNEAPDVAHVYYGHKAVKYLEMLEYWGGPWLVSFHGVDVSKFTEEPGYCEALGEVFAKAQLVLGRSHSLLAELRELGCPPEKLRLNRTPIPLDAFPVMERQAPENGAWRLVQASRIIAKKGLMTTLEALQKVTPVFPNLKFTVCGTGPLEAEFLARRDALGLRDHVEVAGWMKQAQLRETFQQSHVFLHPSELTESSDQEGVPNSMLEAMATGLPVVATWHGGIPEAVTHGHDGLLVPEKSPNDLAEAILRLLQNRDEWSRLAKNASASVREHFGLERQIANLEDCYFECMERWKAAKATKNVAS